MIEHGEVFVKMARIEDGMLVSIEGNQYFLHAADCDAVNRGDECVCNGADVLEELLFAITSKETPR